MAGQVAFAPGGAGSGTGTGSGTGSPVAWRGGGQRPAWVFDTVLAVLTALLAVPVTVFASRVETGYRPMDWLGYALTEAACVALATRRRWPVPTLAACGLLGFTYLGLGYAHGPSMFPLVVALYTVALVVSRRIMLGIAAATTAALVVIGGFADPHSWANTATIGAPGWTVAAIFLGWAVANRRAYLAEIHDRADRAERTRAEQARRAVDAERLRIARELHDVIAHTMSMIYLQAGAAAHVLAEHPEQAATSLAAIKMASKDGLRELRAILNVLRQADDAEPEQPASGLDGLSSLVDSATAAGLTVRASVTGERVPLPPTVDLAAYRIVRESLTNALRHAGSVAVAVGIGYERERLVITVENEPGDRGAANRVAHATGESGSGVIGMGERARALGGTLSAAARPDGGFLVRATLPIRTGHTGTS